MTWPTNCPSCGREMTAAGFFMPEGLQCTRCYGKGRKDKKLRRRRMKEKRREEKSYNPEFVAEIKRIDELPPEAVFDNWKDALDWLQK